jgi:hypothetical protein
MSQTILTSAQQEAGRQSRRDRQDQKAAQAAATVKALLADAGGLLPAYARAHAAKASKGNTRSLIALKCLDCVCWEKSEVADCTAMSCALYPLRPYTRCGKVRGGPPTRSATTTS